MAKKKINKFIFEPGISKDANLFPNAVALLIANRSFIQAQVVAFINAQIASNTSPYNGYTFEPSKCTRDVGFFIDAIAHDLRYGGNVKIRQVADYFWIDGRPMIRGNPAPEITGQQYIRDIINNFIFTNTPVTPTYNQTSVSQVFTLGLNGESNAAQRITSEFEILANVIENGVTALPEKITGVSSIRLSGKYDLSDILLITDTENGEVLYNFADSSNSIKIEHKKLKSSGNGEPVSDVDFRTYIQTSGSITELFLSKDTSNLTDITTIQIFVEDDVTTIRPWEFGTDAIERMRVAAPQAMLDADFEYGLQPTKWQQLSLLRSYPSIYEIPGTDFSISDITTDASTTTGDFGSSVITVRTIGNHGLRIGDAVTVKGLNNNIAGFARAEGSFLVSKIVSSNIFEYFSGSRVGTTFGESLFSSSVQIRKGDFYSGSNIGNPIFSIASQGTSISVETVFDTNAGFDRIVAFSSTGNLPSVGSSISGVNIPPGTSVSGTVGTNSITATVASDTTVGQVSVNVTDVSGTQQGMALDNGTNIARFISSISGNTLNLDGSIDVPLIGSLRVYQNIIGTPILSQGVDAAFNVSIVNSVYFVTDREDSSSNGQNYEVGDLLTIAGNLLGGSTPVNDIVITVTDVDSQGVITDFSFEGTAPPTDDNFLAVPATLIGKAGTGAIFEVTRSNGNYSVAIINAGTNYAINTVLKVEGTILGGSSPANDLEIIVNQVGVTGNITNVSALGTAVLPDTITIFPTITLSEFTVGIIPAGTLLTTGAVSLVEVEFDSAHGLLPGTTITSNITSRPNAEVTTTAGVLPSSGTWTGVAWNGEIFAAIRTGSELTGISTDGINWIAGGSLPNTNAWSSIAGGVVGNTRYFVAVASNSNTAAWSDDDGATWNSVTLPTVTTTTWNHIAFFKGVFIAVRAGSTGAARSTDGGQTWATVTLPGTSTWTSVAGAAIGDQDIFVAVASGGTAAAFSSNLGLTWSATVLPSNSTWRDVAGGNGRFIAIAASTDNIAVSRNGLTWEANQLPSSTTWETIAFDGENFIALSTATAAAISVSGITNEWDEFTVTNGTWNEIADGGPISNPIFVAVGTGTNAIVFDTQAANHQLASGSFVISQVPTPTTFRYPARSTGVINDNIDITGEIYVRPDTFFVHRPYDGGVQLGTGGPQHGAHAVRQSKKYIRYQSGKGIMFTTGSLFAPSYTIASAVADGTAVNSVITFTTDETEHGLQAGGVVEIKGMESFEYNGVYTILSIVDSRTFRVNSNAVLSNTVGTLGPDTTVSVRNWHGATVRTGAFDDQNGLYWQYDGRKLGVGIRTSTLQIAGTISVNTNSNSVTGIGTRFQDQLVVGDKVVVKGMTHTITSIDSQTSLTFTPDWRGARNLVGGKLSVTKDKVINQEDWNLDPLDGTGPSGYNVDPTKMQMIGMQYSWYAVGFIEYMIRGDDGKFIIFHRVKNSNVNTEAYMRTANLPVRYEVENVGAKSYLREAMTDNQTFMIVANASDFPISGTVYIDNELISYSNKSGDRLLNLTRSAQLSNFAAGQNRSYSAGPAAAHAAKSGVILVSCTITPVISHWGSALLTDGLFDEDRGYLFSYTATSVAVSTTKRTAFLIRLAPSVSNAITGDLGERELLNRAQLLLKEISITADTGTGGIVIEGVLNPQNYPENPEDVGWTDLTSSGAGGQPSFTQIAPGGSINWRSDAATSTAIVQGQLNATFTTSISGGTFQNAIQNNQPRFFLTDTDAAASGIQVGDIVNAAFFPAGTRIIGIDPTFEGRPHTRYRTDRNANTTINAPTTPTINIIAQQTANTYAGTNFLFFTENSFIASGASLGTRVAASDTKFPAGTAINGIEQRTLGSTSIIRASFTQTSTTTVSQGNTVTFDFQVNNALPGEQVFSFISNPGNQATLDLTDLKELTTTAIGGRGAFPNGPDVLAINVFKVSGTPVNANIILRWGEAQA